MESTRVFITVLKMTDKGSPWLTLTCMGKGVVAHSLTVN